MNEHNKRLIKNILNELYKDKKKYLQEHQIWQALIKYKRSKKEDNAIFDA